MAVHTTVRAEAQQVKRAVACTQAFGQFTQFRNSTQLVVANRVADPHEFLADDPARADGEVPDFGITHLSIRQSHMGAARLDQCLGIGVTQRIHHRSAGSSDGVVVRVAAFAPPVQDRQNNGSNGSLPAWSSCMAIGNVHSALSVLKVFSRFISYPRIPPLVNSCADDGQLLRIWQVISDIQSSIPLHRSW